MESVIACLVAFGVNFAIAWRWGWKGSLVGLGLGLVLIVGLWAALTIWAYFETGADSANFEFTLWAGLQMVALAGSAFWLVVGGVGALIGLAVGRLRYRGVQTR